MIGGTLANALNAVLSNTEAFQGYGQADKSMTSRVALVSMATLLIMFALILLLGKWLWNTVLVALLPAVKPAKSVWQILGLAVLIGLMYPGYCCQEKYTYITYYMLIDLYTIYFNDNQGGCWESGTVLVV